MRCAEKCTSFSRPLGSDSGGNELMIGGRRVDAVRVTGVLTKIAAHRGGEPLIGSESDGLKS